MSIVLRQVMNLSDDDDVVVHMGTGEVAHIVSNAMLALAAQIR